MILVFALTLDLTVCSNVEIGITSDGNTVVCYHPVADIPYEFTQVRVFSPIHPAPLPFSDKIIKQYHLEGVFFPNGLLTIIKLDLCYFAAYRAARPSNEPTRVPRSGTEGPPQQGGAEQQ